MTRNEILIEEEEVHPTALTGHAVLIGYGQSVRLSQTG